MILQWVVLPTIELIAETCEHVLLCRIKSNGSALASSIGEREFGHNHIHIYGLLSLCHFQFFFLRTHTEYGGGTGVEKSGIFYTAVVKTMFGINAGGRKKTLWLGMSKCGVSRQM